MLKENRFSFIRNQFAETAKEFLEPGQQEIRTKWDDINLLKRLKSLKHDVGDSFYHQRSERRMQSVSLQLIIRLVAAHKLFICYTLFQQLVCK